MPNTKSSTTGNRSPLQGSPVSVVEIRLPHLISETSNKGLHSPLSVLSSQQQVSTFGWDTVFAINVVDANVVIRESGVSPKGFQTKLMEDYETSGSFGTWQIKRGGDGANLHMGIPMPQATLQFQGKTYEVRAAMVTVEVKLCYLPHTSPIGASSGVLQNLVVRTSSTQPADPVASVLSMKLNNGTLDPMVKALMIGALDQWFNANLQQFNHVFAVVNLNKRIDHDQFQWLEPTYTSYAFTDGTSDEDSYLGVLCMTEGRPADKLVDQLSALAIPNDARAGFMISQERFLAKMVLPALPHVFPDSSAEDFRMSDDDLHVINVLPVNTQTVDHGGVTYHPSVQTLSISTVGEEVVIYSLTSVNISPGIDAMVENTSYMKLQLATKPNGEQTVTYVRSRDPVTNHWTKVAEGIKITEIIIEIIGMIVVGVLTVLTGGATLVVALIIVAIIVGIAVATPKLIASVLGKNVGNDVPSIDLLVLSATDPIHWTGGKDFRLTSAGLNGAFQMGGDPEFAKDLNLSTGT